MLSGKRLELILTANDAPFSLSPSKSDFWANAVVMEQVIGTLVKYGQNGTYEPFLVSKWESSLDEKTWTFHFKPGLHAEDGTSINAEAYRRCLLRLLKNYSEDYDPPTFKSLQGWPRFKAGDSSALGITAESTLILKMVFQDRPSGLLEFLAMPYYGFYSDRDFNENGKWKNELSVTSSAAYKVVEASKDSILLQAREDWPSLKQRAAQFVRVYSSTLEKAITNKDKPVIISYRENDPNKYSGFHSFYSTPTVLTGFILSPVIPPFDDPAIRRAFRTLCRSLIKDIIKNHPTAQIAKFLYPTDESIKIEDLELADAKSLLMSHGTLRLKIFQNISGESELSDSDLLLREITKEIGWQFEVITPEMVGKGWQHKARSNREYPLRRMRVDVGGTPENWVIDMMFCSTLGVSFPDPDGSVCNLVSSYNSGKVIEGASYKRKLLESVEKQSTIVPLFHSGFAWLVSDFVSLEGLSQTMNVPRFDQLELVQ